MPQPQPQGQQQPQPVAQPAQAQPAGQAGGQGYNPLQPTYAPTTLSNVNLSPHEQLAQIMKGFMPVQRQATSALNNNLAASGIVGQGGQGAQQLLQGQLSASIAPTLANAIQTAKGQQLQQSQGNAGLATNVNEFNAGSANSAGSLLAQLLQGGWNTQAGGLAGILGSAQAGGNQLASNESNNFDVPGNNNIWGMLGL
jgi:hypothetical protein